MSYVNWTLYESMAPEQRRTYMQAIAAERSVPIPYMPDEPPLTSADRRRLLNPNSPQEW